jgi:L-iditol 2-dehydrogenase
MSKIVAAVMPAPRVPVELREFAEPALEPGSVLLRTLYSEVCGTDVHVWHGRLAGVPYPIIPGHVSVGIADKIRGDVRGVDGTRVAEGDRLVFFDVHRTCGRCRACTVTRTPTRCEARRVYGITDSANEGLFGGWAEAIYLEPGVSMARLPDSVPAETYISGGCGLITAVHIIDRAAITLGDTVLVQGTGAVGLSAIALARLAGATRVVAFGAPADRLQLAKGMGADVTVDIQQTDPVRRSEIVRELTGGLGVDVAIEAAGSARAVEEALNLIRDGGRYVIAGHYTDAGPSAINVHEQINRKHLEIRGCWGSEVGHFVRALRVLEQHQADIPWRAIGARTYTLAELNQALADAEAMRLPKALVRPH